MSGWVLRTFFVTTKETVVLTRIIDAESKKQAKNLARKGGGLKAGNIVSKIVVQDVRELCELEEDQMTDKSSTAHRARRRFAEQHELDPEGIISIGVGREDGEFVILVSVSGDAPESLPKTFDDVRIVVQRKGSVPAEEVQG